MAAKTNKKSAAATDLVPISIGRKGLARALSLGILLGLLSAGISASSAVGGELLFVALDEPDFRFAIELKSLGIPLRVAWAGDIEDWSSLRPNALVILDWNGRDMPPEVARAIRSYVEGGGLLVADANTLLYLGALEGLLTLPWDFPKTGGDLIELEFSPSGGLGGVEYDPASYGRAELKFTDGEVLARFRDGGPAAVLARCGGGAVLALAFNPVWPYWDSGDRDLVRVTEELLLRATSRPHPAPPALIGAVALAGGLGTGELVRRSRRGKALIASLVVRIRRADALRDGKRSAIFSLLRRHPGLNLREISSRLGEPESTVRWHLYVLESRGLVSSTVFLGRRIYYPPEMANEARLRSLLASEVRRRLAETLLLDGPESVRGLARRLGVSAPTVKRNVDVMAFHGVVTVSRNGRSVSVSLSDWAREVIERWLLGRQGADGSS